MRRLPIFNDTMWLSNSGRSRFGARGPGTSVYFRDPDGSLMEFISYAAV
jgi:catechol 2,3-dioxygenase-like lactoylglutathione lyase family enzyme